MASTGVYRVGMVGPGEAIVWTVAAPFVGSTQIDLTAIASRSLSVAMTSKAGAVTLSGWAITSVTATSLIATLIPDGTEFVTPGTHTLRPTLTLDGTPYRLQSFTEEVEPW